MNKVEKQILTNQLCILATLKTLGYDILHIQQLQNINERIDETIRLRNEKGKENARIKSKN